MNIHTATLPNGIKVTRTSQNRTYTHVVAAEFRNGKESWAGGHYTFTPEEGTKWAAMSWSGSEALARKAANHQWGRQLLGTRVISCTVEVKTPKAQAPESKSKAALTREAGRAARAARLAIYCSGLPTVPVRVFEAAIQDVVKAAHAGRLRLAMDEGGGL